MLRHMISKVLLILSVASSLGACSFVEGMTHSSADDAHIEKHTSELDALLNLPVPRQKIFVAVYQFGDQTGQHKPNDNYTDYSTAVTQGGSSGASAHPDESRTVSQSGGPTVEVGRSITQCRRAT